jgi:general stress protein 26
MNTQNEIGFITGKILELQTAILHIHSNTLLNSPASLVYTQHVDEKGWLWMLISKPLQYHHELDCSFHVALNYYKKGSAFFLNTYGLASVVNSPEEISQMPQALLQNYSSEKLLICVHILEANYYENEPRPVKNRLQKYTQLLSDLFIGNTDYYQFNEADLKYFA